MVAGGGTPATSWSSHFSPKYNRCFVRLINFPAATLTNAGGPLVTTFLFDAFERSNLAKTSAGLGPDVGCRNEQKPEECAQLARIFWKAACTIDEEETDCTIADQFIKEHMKN